MRAYLAVIKDSFREAFASKILWVLIIMIAGFAALSILLGWANERAGAGRWRSTPQTPS